MYLNSNIEIHKLKKIIVLLQLYIDLNSNIEIHKLKVKTVEELEAIKI